MAGVLALWPLHAALGSAGGLQEALLEANCAPLSTSMLGALNDKVVYGVVCRGRPPWTIKVTCIRGECTVEQRPRDFDPDAAHPQGH